ncbi:MAG: flagellar motor switch phosphatase FliY [Synergistaceae bacterium]|jgi:flagellar motor switch protein FliN/FliY|nr:flagellar motor switch phosphatase FliY [Synergistaceae bacterium]
MVDEFLNQDEIDALLSGSEENPGDSGSASTGAGSGAPILTGDDMTVMKEVAGVISSASSNVIGMLAGRTVSANLTEQVEIQQGELIKTVEGAHVFSYSMNLDGLDSMPAMFVMGERGALALADLMMGGDAKDLPQEANDLYLSAAQEGLSQLVGSALTSLSGLLGGGRLSATSSEGHLAESAGWMPFPDEAAENYVWVAQINLDVEGVEPFMLDVVLSSKNAVELTGKIRDAMAPKSEPEQAAAQPQAAGAPKSPQPQQQQQRPQQPQPAQAPQAPMQVSLPPRPQGPPVDVRSVEFSPLGGSEYAGNQGNIDLIVDIPVRVTVELGRTRKTIGEVLALGPGSVVELNKMAGEPVDVLVNGKLIARGEVVVIDESFGIRVTEVVSKAERIRSMGV